MLKKTKKVTFVVI